MVFLLEEKSRPTPAGMKLWVDLIGYLKVSTFGEEGEEGRGREGLDFFTYSELVVWIVYVLSLFSSATLSTSTLLYLRLPSTSISTDQNISQRLILSTSERTVPSTPSESRD